jgi:hypothetical protein
MTRVEGAASNTYPGQQRMHMRYGVTEAEDWWYFSRGTHREQIRARLRAMSTQVIGIFLFDKGAPDPVTDWETFASCVQAVLDTGAKPMITFAKFRRPFDDPRAVRWFANQCADVVWNCIEQWGGETVREWYWCVWNEPNSVWIGGGLSFEQYRRIYEEVGHAILRWLVPHLRGRKLLLGGPAVEGFLPFWIDWYWRFVHEIDNSLIGFASWHRYGDWRAAGESGAPRDEATYRAMLIAQTPDFEARARALGRLLKGRGILNICGELNAHSHSEPAVRAGFNQTIFGAAFYASALLHLMRGGTDVEMFWTGTDHVFGYGMLDKDGTPRPVFHAKMLCAQHVRYGDWLSFPNVERAGGALDAVVARGEGGPRSALFVHKKEEPRTYRVSELVPELVDGRCLLKIDGETGNQVVQAAYDGVLRFEGYGVAAVTAEERP